MTSALQPKHVGLIGFDGVAALDLTGVMDAFSIANWRETPPRYETMLVTATAAPLRAPLRRDAQRLSSPVRPGPIE